MIILAIMKCAENLSQEQKKKAIIETQMIQMNKLLNVINLMLLINGGQLEGRNSKIIEMCTQTTQ